MESKKLSAGQPFPVILLPEAGGGTLKLGQPNGETPSGKKYWQLIIVYRGKHCPLCTRYLKEIKLLKASLEEMGIELFAISADPKEKVEIHMKDIAPNFPIGYDLSLVQMQALGLYISHPRSAQETDRPFAEPGLFVVNDQAILQMTDISNAPFLRPNPETLLQGLKFIRDPDNKYPVRGTYP